MRAEGPRRSPWWCISAADLTHCGGLVVREMQVRGRANARGRPGRPGGVLACVLLLCDPDSSEARLPAAGGSPSTHGSVTDAALQREEPQAVREAADAAHDMSPRQRVLRRGSPLPWSFPQRPISSFSREKDIRRVPAEGHAAKCPTSDAQGQGLHRQGEKPSRLRRQKEDTGKCHVAPWVGSGGRKCTLDKR